MLQADIVSYLSRRLLVSSTMPPRKASTTKRKASSPVDNGSEEEAEVQKPVKRAKKVDKLANGTKSETAVDVDYLLQPTNMVIPAPVVLSKVASGDMRIATWNVAGLAAASKKVS